MHSRRIPNSVPLVIMLLFIMTAAVAHAGPTVVFDQGHGQRFLVDREEGLNLSGLAALFREAGYNVGTTSAPLTSGSLKSADALVISGAFESISPAEIDAIVNHLYQGGTVAVMLHVAPPLTGLLHRLGVQHSYGVIKEQEQILGGNNPLDFRATCLTEHLLSQEIRSLSLYGAWALRENATGVQPVCRTSPSAWIDLNRNGILDQKDARKAFAVVVAGQVGSGRFVVFGDDALFQNKFLVGDNRTLGRNLARWLTPAKPMEGTSIPGETK